MRRSAGIYTLTSFIQELNSTLAFFQSSVPPQPTPELYFLVAALPSLRSHPRCCAKDAKDLGSLSAELCARCSYTTDSELRGGIQAENRERRGNPRGCRRTYSKSTATTFSTCSLTILYRTGTPRVMSMYSFDVMISGGVRLVVTSMQMQMDSVD